MKHNLLIVFVCLTISMSACKPTYPGTMDDPSPVTPQLSISSVDTTLTGVSNGYYDLVAYVKGTTDCALAIQAGGRMSSVLLNDGVWTPLYLKGIEVTNGTLSIASKKAKGTQFQSRGISLTAGTARKPLLCGGDLSLLSRVESSKGKFYNQDSVACDGIQLMANCGMNIARLRLYNDPGNRKFYPSKLMYKGVEDPTNILALAKRVKDAGMQIELTFHYSDYWTNGGIQYKPHAWKDCNETELEDSVYQFTRDFLERMVAQGTAPEYVSLGNEIQSGILFGTIDPVTNLPSDSVNGFCNDMPKLARLLNQGAKAVREVCPQAKVVIHLTTSVAIDLSTYKWFFGNMQTCGLDYDIIGISYYPYSDFGGRTIEEICALSDEVAAIYNKDVLLMEVGFAWTDKLASGSDGQLSNNGPYAVSKEAQRTFLFDLMRTIQNLPSNRILGLIYWDPIYYDVNGKTGWINGGENVTGNSTLVDYNGYILPAIEAFKYNK